MSLLFLFLVALTTAAINADDGQHDWYVQEVDSAEQMRRNTEEIKEVMKNSVDFLLDAKEKSQQVTVELSEKIMEKMESVPKIEQAMKAIAESQKKMVALLEELAEIKGQ